MGLSVGDVLFVEHVPTATFHVIEVKTLGGPAPVWALQVERYQRASLILEHALQVGLQEPLLNKNNNRGGGVVVVQPRWVAQCRVAVPWEGRNICSL